MALRYDVPSVTGIVPAVSVTSAASAIVDISFRLYRYYTIPSPVNRFIR
jgi:hypothetical protein